MDAFTYLSVLISIILGLAITQLLQGARALVIARRRVRVFGPSVQWVGLLLLLAVQSWWAMFGLQYHRDWTFIAFGIVLLQVILLYMLASLVLPDFPPYTSIDLRAHYFEHVVWFYGLAVLLLVVSLIKDLLINGHLPGAFNVAFHLVFIVVWAGAAATRREAYHRFVPIFMALAFGAYIAVLFGRLQ